MARNPRMTKERRQKVIEYLQLPESQRIPLPDFRKQTGVHKNTFAYVKAEYEAEQRELMGKREQWNQARDIMAQNREGVEVRIDRGEPIILIDEPQMPESEEEQVEEVLNALWNMSVARKNVFASKIWLQAKGQLIERREDKITVVNADDIARQQFEAERRLREIGRVVNVQKKHPLLSDPPCTDNQQEHGKDSKVGSVGLST